MGSAEMPPLLISLKRNYRSHHRSGRSTVATVRFAAQGLGFMAIRESVRPGQGVYGLAVDAELTRAASSAERLALAMAENLVAGHKTPAAGKGYDTHDFVMEVRECDITPHVAQNACETATASAARRSTAAPLAIPVRAQPDKAQAHRGDLGLAEDRRRPAADQIPRARSGPHGLHLRPAAYKLFRMPKLSGSSA